FPSTSPWALLQSSGVCDQEPISCTVKSLPAGSSKKLSFLEEGVLMGQKLGCTLLVIGGFLLLLGVSFVPAALLEHSDETILGAGICTIAFGALTCAAGFYVKTRALESSATRGSAGIHKVRGGCDLCRSEAPVVHCRVHQLHICGTCLAT